MKLFILAFLIPCAAFACQVDEVKFKKLIKKEIRKNYYGISQLSQSDTSDIYTYYFILGKIQGLKDSRIIFNDCVCEE